MRLIIAEDEDVVRDIYQKKFISMGLEVYAFDNGKSALDFFNNNYDNIDMILSDHVMPELTGIELFMQIRKLQHQCRFYY